VYLNKRTLRNIMCPFTSALELGQYLDDSSKLILYKRTIEENEDCEYDTEAYFWKFWDVVSILAFYAKEYALAQKAYKKCVEIDKIPQEQQDRIYRNAVHYDFGENLSYDVCKKHISKLKREPNAFHLIYLRGMDFALHHYITIKSILKHHPHSTIYLYNDCEPDANNTWWALVKSLSRVEICPVYIPKYCNGVEVTYKQHQADIIRLLILYYHGGIYLDLDMLLLRNITSVCNNHLVMCRESPDGVCNAFIYVDGAYSDIIGEWIQKYEQTYDRHWTKCSIHTPHELSVKYPEAMTTLPKHTFLPFDYTHTSFFTSPNKTVDFSQSFAIHLWETETSKLNLFPKELQSFRKSNSVYYQMVKDLLENDYKEKEHNELVHKIDELVSQVASLHVKIDKLLGTSNKQDEKESFQTITTDMSFLQNLIKMK